jgi:hypothetical protein
MRLGACAKRSPLRQPQDRVAVALAHGRQPEEKPAIGSKRARLQGRGFGCWPTPSNLRFRPGSQFHEARSLCQSRHAAKAATIPTAAPKATNKATISAMSATRVSVIEVRRRVYAQSLRTVGPLDNRSNCRSACLYKAASLRSD